MIVPYGPHATVPSPEPGSEQQLHVLTDALVQGCLDMGIEPMELRDRIMQVPCDPLTGFEAMTVEALELNYEILEPVVRALPSHPPGFDVVSLAWTRMACRLGCYKIMASTRIPKYKVDRVLKEDAQAFWDMWRYICRLTARSKSPQSKSLEVARLKALAKNESVPAHLPATADHSGLDFDIPPMYPEPEAELTAEFESMLVRDNPETEHCDLQPYPESDEETKRAPVSRDERYSWYLERREIFRE